MIPMGQNVLPRDAFSAMFLLHSQQVGERIPGYSKHYPGEHPEVPQRFLAEESVDLSNIDPPNEHVTVY